MTKTCYPVLHFPLNIYCSEGPYQSFFTKSQAFSWWFPKIPKEYEKECSEEAVMIDGECVEVSKICANKHQNDATITATTTSLTAESIKWDTKMEDDMEVCRQ